MPGGYRAIAAIKWTSLGVFSVLSRLRNYDSAERPWLVTWPKNMARRNARSERLLKRQAHSSLILGTRNAKTKLDIRSDSGKPAGESSGKGIPSFRQNAWARKNYSTPCTRPN